MKILAGALALCFVTCAADVAVADTYKYVFTKSSKAKDFKTIRTKWVVRARAYRPLSSPTGYSATLLRNKKFSNVSVATMIVSDPYHYEGGPILRVKRSGDAISGYGGLVLGNNGIFSVYINRYDRYSLDTIGGRLTNLCFAYFTADKARTIEFVAEKKSLKLYYDGKMVCSTEDSTYTSGDAGLMTTTTPTVDDPKVADFSRVSFSD